MPDRTFFEPIKLPQIAIKLNKSNKMGITVGLDGRLALLGSTFVLLLYLLGLLECFAFLFGVAVFGC